MRRSHLVINLAANQKNVYTYVGAEGMIQYQRDQSYLAKKALLDKCSQAKVDLAVAETNKDKSEIKLQQELIKDTCVQ